jgi:hypothetical protein
MGRKTISSRLPYLSAEILSSLDRRTRRSDKVPKVQPIYLWSRQLGGQTTRKPRNSSLPTHNHLLSGFLFLNRWQHCSAWRTPIQHPGLVAKNKVRGWQLPTRAPSQETQHWTALPPTFFFSIDTWAWTANLARCSVLPQENAPDAGPGLVTHIRLQVSEGLINASQTAQGATQLRRGPVTRRQWGLSAREFNSHATICRMQRRGPLERGCKSISASADYEICKDSCVYFLPAHRRHPVARCNSA